jgi:hypothetical protein
MRWHGEGRARYQVAQRDTVATVQAHEKDSDMTGAAKALDKIEEKVSPIDPLGPGAMKKKYGDKRGVDTSEGYAAGKEKKMEQEAEATAAKDAADAKAAADAAAEAAVQKGQQSQADALKRKGRRAAILTSGQGVADPLGVPGA